MITQSEKYKANPFFSCALRFLWGLFFSAVMSSTISSVIGAQTKKQSETQDSSQATHNQQAKQITLGALAPKGLYQPIKCLFFAEQSSEENGILHLQNALLLKPRSIRDPELLQKSIQQLRQPKKSGQKLVSKSNRESFLTILNSYQEALHELQLACHCSRWHFASNGNIPSAKSKFLLEKLSSLQELSIILQLRCRWYMEEKKFQQAWNEIECGLMLGKKITESSNLVSLGIGLPILHHFLDEIEYWQQLNDSPEIYHPLTALQTPFLDFSSVLTKEQSSFDSQLFMQELTVQQVLPTEKLNQIQKHWFTSAIQESQKRFPHPDDKSSWTDYISKHSNNGLNRLAQIGATQNQLKDMSALQIVLLDIQAQVKAMQMECFLWATRPYPEAKKGYSQLRAQLKEMENQVEGMRSPSCFLLTDFVNMIDEYQRRVIQIDRRIACLRIIEALRIEAKTNHQLVNRLDQLQLPIPTDFGTGQPFNYSVKQAIGYLEAPALAEDRKRSTTISRSNVNSGSYYLSGRMEFIIHLETSEKKSK